jgi:multisubunit Na+/H+ antiporter MnhC subunit
MLTDIVVEATVAALLLSMVVKANELANTVDPDELRILTG